LTKNREKAIEYFYQLSSLDLEQKSKCDFYIWISYYRLWKYEKSISTLNQLISNDVYKSDVFRYLLLNYEKLWDTNKMIQVWQKQLWTYNLRENDFKMFFDFVFYTPFSMDEKFTIFLNYKQMAYDFVTTCYDKFGSKNDTCIYGEVWLDLANWDFVSAKSNLIYLSEKYPQANIFKALWDYYKKINEIWKAKDYYIKAASITNSPAQKMKLESILIDL
jgi:tetratricopeptide (TPR) repeat protein